MITRWDKKADGDMLNINEEMMEVTMTVLFKSVYGLDPRGDERLLRAGEAIKIMLEYAAETTLQMVPAPLWFPTRLNLRYKQAMKFLDDFTYDIIRERRKNPSDDSLLTMMMTVKDEETGTMISDELIRDEALTLFFAGHDTTSQVLSWTLKIIAEHPHIEEKLWNEVDTVLKGRVPTWEDVPNLQYTRMIIDETLRVYPTVPFTARDTMEDDEVGGYYIPKGSIVLVAPYYTHRHVDYWGKNAEIYDPENFAPEQAEKRHKQAYFPFGFGPRICIGSHFALLEMTLVVAEIAQKFKLRWFKQRPNQEIIPLAIGTSRTSEDILMTLHRR